MNGFQDLMRQFLDTQKSVMQTFLQSYADEAAPIAAQQLSFPPQQRMSTPDQPLPSMPPPEAAVADKDSGHKLGSIPEWSGLSRWNSLA